MRLLLFTFLVLFAHPIWGQQLPLFTQYRDNIGLINPAGINSDYYFNNSTTYFGASYRKQWFKQEDSPNTTHLQFEHIWSELGQVGLIGGAHIIHDEAGKISTTGAYGRLAGIIGNPYFGGFSLGINFGYVQYRIASSETQALEAGDPILSANQVQWAPDVGFGLYYFRRSNNYNYIYAGVSIPQFFELDLNNRRSDLSFGYQRLRHYYGVLGAYIYTGDLRFFEPSIWIRSVEGSPISIDLNVRYQLISNFWVGVGGSTAKAGHVEWGVRLAGDKTAAKLSYSVTFGFNDYNPFFGNTHELHLSFSLPQ